MPLTPSEKQRRYREKRDKDPERRKAYLEKEKQKYRDDKKTGKKLSIGSMSKRAQRRQRRMWNNAQRKYRNMKKQLKVDEERKEQTLTVSMNFNKDLSDKKITSLKNKYRRNLEKLRNDLKKQEKIADKYRKRLERHISKISIPNSPRKQCKVTLKSGKSVIHKTLLFHYSFIADLKKKYCESKGSTKHKLYSKLLMGELLKKYRLKGYAKKTLNWSCHKGAKQTVKNCKNVRLGQSVRAFYLRDDVSRIIAGKKQTVTFHKIKKQKRVLLDSVQNIFAKYLSENPEKTLSYTLFCRLRPFWVKHPTEADRQTCICKVHANIHLLFKSVSEIYVCESLKPDDFVKQNVCDINSLKCMYSKCNKCKNNTFESVVKTNDCIREKEVCWEQWKNVKEKRMVAKGGETKEIVVSVTVKKKESGTLFDLMKEVDKQLIRYKKHLFNIRNQYSYFRELVNKLSGNECLIHVDFSQNYVCKMHSEVQSMHFGASARQCSLHTGIYYVGNIKQSFCSISNSTNHGPSAIWEHLAPVLDEIQGRFPAVNTIHFFSDGPTTQYRQKGNFYLFSTILATRGIDKATWNFLEAGHGKGVPDGIGGVIKRTADRLVRESCDISNAESLYSTLKQEKLSTNIYYVDGSKIESALTRLAHKDIATVPNTMSLHQICTCRLYQISYSDVSCRCMNPFTCKCIEKKYFNFDTVVKCKKLKAKKLTKGEPNNAAKSSNVDMKQSSKISSNDATDMPGNISQIYNSENQTSNSSQNDIKEKNEKDRENFFKSMLIEFHSSNDYADLRAKCLNTYVDLPYDISYQTSLSIVDNRFTVDLVALDLCPDDIPENKVLFPVKVKPDGDCLAHCGSICAFGNEMKEVEIRARIIRELIISKSKYLDYTYLRKGVDITDTEAQKLPAEYAMFSEYYEMEHMSEKNIENVFEKEVLSICKKGVYMGIWQIFALANVLQSNIYSVYPKLGNPNVRKQLHRRILTDTKETTNTYFIMWSTTRDDMTTTHWVPNHFVVLLPPDSNKKQSDDCTVENVSMTVDPEVTNTENKLQVGEQTVGMYVIVRYDNRIYPGKIVEANEREIRVTCMMPVKGKADLYYWPRVPDICWYLLENVERYVYGIQKVGKTHFKIIYGEN